MKTLFLFLILCILYGCTEPGFVEPNPPIPVPKKFTVDISGNATTTPSGIFQVDEGTIVPLAVQAPVGFDLDSLYLNNEKLKLTGKTYNKSLLVTTNYTIKVMAKKEAVVIVPTNLDTLCLSPWKEIKNESMKIDGLGWQAWKLNQEQLENTLVFHLNKTYERFHSNGTRFGSGSFEITKDSLFFGGLEYKISKLTDKELVVISPMPYYTDLPDANGKYTLLGYVDLKQSYTH